MVLDDGNDPIMITIGISKFDVKWILIDDDSDVEVLFLNAFQVTGMK